MSSQVAAHRLTVLVALSDPHRAEQLADALGAADDVLPLLAGSGKDQAVDAVVVDEVALESRAVAPDTPAVLLAGRNEGQRQASNVRAVLPATADGQLVAAALRLVVSGYRISRIASPDAAMGDFQSEMAEDEPTDDTHPRAALSPREAEVLALLAEGAPNKVIARRLNISVHTAKFHVAAILIKLGAANRTDAIAIAMRQGLVLV